jgi:hypothetical protein
LGLSFEGSGEGRERQYVLRGRADQFSCFEGVRERERERERRRRRRKKEVGK